MARTAGYPSDPMVADRGSTAEEAQGPATFRTEPSTDTWVVHVAGELDAQSGAHLRSLLSGAFDDKPAAVVVDLADLGFVDSVGLSVLVSGHNRARAAGVAFQVRNVPPVCMRVFEITRLTDVLDIT